MTTETILRIPLFSDLAALPIPYLWPAILPNPAPPSSPPPRPTPASPSPRPHTASPLHGLRVERVQQVGEGVGGDVVGQVAAVDVHQPAVLVPDAAVAVAALQQSAPRAMDAPLARACRERDGRGGLLIQLPVMSSS